MFIFAPEELNGERWLAVLTNPERDFIGYIRHMPDGWQTEPETTTERYATREEAAQSLIK